MSRRCGGNAGERSGCEIIRINPFEVSGAPCRSRVTARPGPFVPVRCLLKHGWTCWICPRRKAMRDGRSQRSEPNPGREEALDDGLSMTSDAGFGQPAARDARHGPGEGPPAPAACPTGSSRSRFSAARREPAAPHRRASCPKSEGVCWRRYRAIVRQFIEDKAFMIEQLKRYATGR